MMVSSRNFLFQWSIFRGYVSFREGNFNIRLFDAFFLILAVPVVGLVAMLTQTFRD